MRPLLVGAAHARHLSVVPSFYPGPGLRLRFTCTRHSDCSLSHGSRQCRSGPPLLGLRAGLVITLISENLSRALDSVLGTTAAGRPGGHGLKAGLGPARALVG